MTLGGLHLIVGPIVFMGCGGTFAGGNDVARVPLVPSDTKDPIVGPIFDGIRARGGQPLHMHRAVANAPKIFKSYVDMAIALRTAAATPRPDRELIILRTAQLVGGDYEFAQHRPMAVSCGITAAQLDTLSQWKRSGSFSDKQKAILAYADGMVSSKGVDDAVFRELQKYFNDQEIVELTITSAFYGAVAQITRALDVKLEPNAGQTAYGIC
jgi:alkylhydroperoxidase family enzyme